MNVVVVVVVIITLIMPFIDARWHSSLLDTQLFRAYDCDIDHFQVRVRINVFPYRAMRQRGGGEV